MDLDAETVSRDPSPERSSPAAENLLEGAALSPGSAPRGADTKGRYFLRKVAEGAVKPVLIVSGASGSGKSYVIDLLDRIGVRQADRCITRPPRPSDSEYDRRWSPKPSDARDMHFAYEKYHQGYAFSIRELVRANKAGESTAFIAGDVGKIAQFVESIRAILPFTPIVVLRVEAPAAVIERRLRAQRDEGFSGEAAERVAANARLSSWEQGQRSTLQRLYGMTAVQNISAADLNLLSPDESHIQPLSEEILATLVARFMDQAQSAARLAALDVLRARSVPACGTGIPPALLSTLEGKFSDAAAQASVPAILKGGLAVELYLADSRVVDRPELAMLPAAQRVTAPLRPFVRPVSLDIDWTFAGGVHSQESHQDLVAALTGVRAEFSDAFQKPIFKSRKIASAVEVDGIKVELDAIACSRVQPEGRTFVFEFPCDGLLVHHRRESVLPNGARVFLAPPEMLVLEKLTAARGVELGKYDLFDAAALALTQPLDPSLMQHIIELQSVNASCERVPPLDAWRSEIRDAPLREIIERRTALGATPPMGFAMDGDALKRAAFLDALLEGLARIERDVDMPVPLGDVTASLAEIFGRDAVLSRVNDLREFVRYYGEYQLGRTDVYVKRSPGLSFRVFDRGPQ